MSKQRKLDLYLTPYIKINFKCNENLNVKKESFNADVENELEDMGRGKGKLG